MTTFEFNSQICTTKEQSERLLALGLKKETADMWYPHFASTYPIPLTEDDVMTDCDIPAWSLHRLLEIDNVGVIEFYNNDIPNIYDHMVNYIEKRIKMGLINPEYLEEEK